MRRYERIHVPDVARATADVLVRYLFDRDGTAATAVRSIHGVDGTADVAIALAVELLEQLDLADDTVVTTVDWSSTTSNKTESVVALANAVVSYTWSGERRAIVVAIDQAKRDQLRLLGVLILLADAVRLGR